jgi:hypothetical protein
MRIFDGCGGEMFFSFETEEIDATARQKIFVCPRCEARVGVMQ